MASLDVGNWILRGTRTVETAGTLVAVGLLRDSSGLLLERLVELGSSGGENPDILTNGCCLFAGSCNSPREQAQRPKKVRIETTLKDQCGTMYKTRRVFAANGYLCTSAKLNSG